MQEYTAIVKNVKKETPTVSTITFEVENRPFFKTGQYFSIKHNERFRPYSLCSPEQETLIQTCVKNVGECSNFLCNLKSNDKVQLIGPMGVFILKKPIEKDLVFLATGSGISPIIAMILDALKYTKTDKQIYLLFGNKTINEIIYKEEFESLEKQHKNFHFIPVVSREEFKNKGHIQDHLNKVPNPKEKEFYLCGVKPMVEAITKDLTNLKIEKSNINHEKFV